MQFSIRRPLAAIWEVYKEGEIQEKPNIDWWAVFLGAGGFVAGILMLGNRTIDTVGNKLSALTPSKAFGTQVCVRFPSDIHFYFASLFNMKSLSNLIPLRYSLLFCIAF